MSPRGCLACVSFLLLTAGCFVILDFTDEADAAPGVYTIEFDACGGNSDTDSMQTSSDGRLSNLPNAH